MSHDVATTPPVRRRPRTRFARFRLALNDKWDDFTDWLERVIRRLLA